MTSCPLAERWTRWRCCASSLASNHALKPLMSILCLVVVFAYDLADKLRAFVVRIFIPQYHYPYIVSLCFGQVLVSVSFFNLLHVLGVASLRRYSRPLGERLLVPSICSSAHAVLAMWGEASGSYGGLFPLAARLLPLTTVGLSLALKVTAPPSGHASVLVSILTGSSLVFTDWRGPSVAEPLEYMYAPLAVILLSLSLTWLSKVSEYELRLPPDHQASALDIYYTQLVNQCWLLGLLWTLHPDGPLLVLSRASWHSLLFHGYLLAILLLGTLLDLAVAMTALCKSPLAAGLLHTAGQLMQPFVLLLWL
ncbi:uncharacterized protein si:ch211-248a14.8 isoform X1 [Dunckerocampus dactyliophorus]|uniref:uncharacterized protein si:ch211-248a14.8 isoform X1 n=1 Tax=Dunckerocampus dactyliophorus TaxID=161453 RepID=UPI002407499A|nr:uncharacterized protein si:ch211-248a14.8 isoform X1 [Dunckerocampus dactyliophorus]